jgi:hypothetical protein
VSPKGVGLLDLADEPPSIRGLAATFRSFILAQENAYDAYRRFIVKNGDIEPYRSSSAACAQSLLLGDADVELI